MKTYVKFGLLTSAIVGSLVWLAMGGVSESKTYYRTIGELQRMGSDAHGKRLRVGGYVQQGSIVKRPGEVAFLLHQDPQPGAHSQLLSVVYRGSDPLPDTFKDNAQALADGRLNVSGVFEASKIQAKCASKYESKPAQRGVSHDATQPDRVTQNFLPADRRGVR